MAPDTSSPEDQFYDDSSPQNLNNFLPTPSMAPISDHDYHYCNNNNSDNLLSPIPESYLLPPLIPPLMSPEFSSALPNLLSFENFPQLSPFSSYSPPQQPPQVPLPPPPPLPRQSQRDDYSLDSILENYFKISKQKRRSSSSAEKAAVTLEMLEKKEQVLLKKAAAEVEKAKEFTRAKNKRAAITCLKRKRLYEQQVEQLGNMQLRIHDQMILLEGAKATTETVDALRSGASAMKAMQKATNIDNVDQTMDEINEQTENLKQIQEALSAPIGAAADFDEVQSSSYLLVLMTTFNSIVLTSNCFAFTPSPILKDELEAELEELEGAELEEQLLQPATTAPAAPVYVSDGKQPVRPTPQKKTAEEEELEALQAEMAL
uniref:Uncharacterized protein n=1 Tax=Chenopodium quinoa TaxID=63459 RepID=A0A803N749_CHEQI